MASERFAHFHPMRQASVGVALALFASTLAASPVFSSARPRQLEVQTVDQLYLAIDRAWHDCGHTRDCDVQIHLAPGTYVLSGTSPAGPPRPRAGSLRLPPGVSLVGSERHVDKNGDGVPDPIDRENPDVFAVPGTETIIDGSQLVLEFEPRTDCAGQTRNFPDPVVYAGRNNAISSLTLVGGDNVPIGEPTNDRIDPDGSLTIQITDAVLQGNHVAMTFANAECGARHARSVLSLSHSVVRGGLLMQNFFTGDANDDPTDGPEIRATVAFNLFYGNGTALHATGGDDGTDGGSVTLHTIGNVFLNNGTNLQLRGSVGRDGLHTVGNKLVVTSDSDTFGEAPESVFLSGATGDAVGNSVRAEFFDSRFIRDSADTPAEITIFGGEDVASGSRVVVGIRHARVETSEGDDVDGELVIADETGAGDPPSTARLEGSRTAFLRLNQGLPAPPEEFFVGH